MGGKKNRCSLHIHWVQLALILVSMEDVIAVEVLEYRNRLHYLNCMYMWLFIGVLLFISNLEFLNFLIRTSSPVLTKNWTTVADLGAQLHKIVCMCSQILVHYIMHGNDVDIKVDHISADRGERHKCRALGGVHKSNNQSWPFSTISNPF